jgi:hypothetical protein
MMLRAMYAGQYSEAFDAMSTVGNEPGVRFLNADVTELPAYQGPFDAVVGRCRLTL